MATRSPYFRRKPPRFLAGHPERSSTMQRTVTMQLTMNMPWTGIKPEELPALMAAALMHGSDKAETLWGRETLKAMAFAARDAEVQVNKR